MNTPTRQQGYRQAQTGPTRQIAQAPYNFVPLSAKVVFPDWGHLVSHDLPFKDGISGEIHYTLRATQPLLVGGKQRKNAQGQTVVEFYKTPDGNPAIPGSSLKGMIRAVVEIAGFGKMQRVDDVRFGVRDLHNQKLYVQKMTESAHQGGYQSKVKAGWMSFKDGEWVIEPCEYARIEHDELAKKQTNKDFWEKMLRFPAMVKYAKWTGELEVTCNVTDVKKQKNGLVYRDARFSDKGKKGFLVFTGQPSERGGKGAKNKEFFFYEPKPEQTFVIPPEVMEGFMTVHAESKEWAYWKNNPDQRIPRNRIPVFYLEEDGQIQSLGLAQMYKLAYKYTVWDMLAHTSVDHLDASRADLAELLFGRIKNEEQGFNLRGRVAFELARADRSTIREAPEITSVLNSPKPTFYPNYIRQDADQSGKVRREYMTYMDDKAQLRGWKRYPVRNGEIRPVRSENDKVMLRLKPLASGATFKGRVVFHNLRPIELGALLWAMTWDGNSSLRHSLGMGKPLGLGQVKLTLDAEPILHFNHPDHAGMTPSACIRAFKDYMQGQVSHWEQSPQITALLDMANPSKAEAFEKRTGTRLAHMKLKPNQFIETKKAKSSLPEYTERPVEPVEGKGPPFAPSIHRRPTAAVNMHKHNNAGEGKGVFSAPPPPEPGKVTWNSVLLRWNAADRILEIHGPENRKLDVKGDNAVRLMSKLSLKTRTNLERDGAVRARATVRITEGKITGITLES